MIHAHQALVVRNLFPTRRSSDLAEARANVAHRCARKRTESEREATIDSNRQIFQRMAAEKNKREERSVEHTSEHHAVTNDVSYNIIHADLQAARELYRILVAGGS